MQTSRALVLAASVAALTVPAAAQAQHPTLQFDRPCYTEQQDMRFTGADYTPGGQVDLLFAQADAPRGIFTTHADVAGAINGVTGVGTADQLLEHHEDRDTIFVSANDRTRIDSDQQPPESQFGFTQFLFTRWEGFSPGRYVPGQRATVEIYGWAFAAGDKAWFLFRKGSATRASVKVGRLDAVCGDLKAKIKVPRTLKPGAYRVVLTTDRKLHGPYTWRKARVTAGGSAAATADTMESMSGGQRPATGRIASVSAT
jgi:hypothetical protein